MARKPSVEIASAQLHAELIEIKERVGALENVAGLVNRAAIEAHVRQALRQKKRREIMKECDQPRTRMYLRDKLGHASDPALDHHLRPLRDESLIHVRTGDDGVQCFEWSNIVKRIPRSKLTEIINDPSD